jgi:hypothetical protein
MLTREEPIDRAVLADVVWGLAGGSLLDPSPWVLSYNRVCMPRSALLIQDEAAGAILPLGSFRTWAA